MKDAQEILKSLLTKKKVILVFDNAKNWRQIEDIVSIDDILINNDSTLIMISWDWKIIKNYAIKIY